MYGGETRDRSQPPPVPPAQCSCAPPAFIAATEPRLRHSGAAERIPRRCGIRGGERGLSLSICVSWRPPRRCEVAQRAWGGSICSSGALPPSPAPEEPGVPGVPPRASLTPRFPAGPRRSPPCPRPGSLLSASVGTRPGRRARAGRGCSHLAVLSPQVRGCCCCYCCPGSRAPREPVSWVRAEEGGWTGSVRPAEGCGGWRGGEAPATVSSAPFGLTCFPTPGSPGSDPASFPGARHLALGPPVLSYWAGGTLWSEPTDGAAHVLVPHSSIWLYDCTSNPYGKHRSAVLIAPWKPQKSLFRL